LIEMKIVRPYARILSGGNGYGGNPMPKIEWCSRISHRAEDKQTDDSWRRFIQSVVIEHGDWSVVEHVSVTVDAVVDRGITHEWVRHRLFSYTQESTRFVNYEKKMPPSFIYPIPEVECEHCAVGLQLLRPNDPEMFSDGKPYVWQHYVGGEHVDCPYNAYWLDAIRACEGNYKELLSNGWRPQEARSVFPNALASRLVCTGNLRNWRHFFIMRTTAEAHPQMRQVSIPLLAEFKSSFPLLFDDIEPNAKQSESMKRMR
jgi:thymidylate synthase (FAD)